MKVMQVLTNQYTQPHRYYHTLEHIAHMFNTAKLFDIQLTEAQIQAIGGMMPFMRLVLH